jgi:hypothetical protein
MVVLRRGVAGRVGESNDAYPDVVAVLDGQTRVIACQDGIQWILQKKVNHNDPTQMWRGRSFCRTKEALLRCAGVKSGENPVLDDLPERFPEPPKGRDRPIQSALPEQPGQNTGPALPGPVGAFPSLAISGPTGPAPPG